MCLVLTLKPFISEEQEIQVLRFDLSQKSMVYINDTKPGLALAGGAT